MARTLIIGLTESGKKSRVNEDSFSLGGRVYPDMITGSEERSGKSAAYTQLYAVTQGYGGSGAGDLAGRIVQRTAMDLAEGLAAYKQPDLDFCSLASAIVHEAHHRIHRQIKPKGGENPGSSLALLLIDANIAYILNVGQTGIYLFRDNKLMKPSLDLVEKGSRPEWLIGQGEIPPLSCPMIMKQFRLRAGDIILLASQGFSQAYPEETLASDLASPDAFAATIRQAQINSRQGDNTLDGTILAVKVRDLELSLPGKDVLELENRRTLYQYEDTSQADREGNPENDLPISWPTKSDEADPEKTKKAEKKLRRKRNLKTFFLFLLLGFLIGMAFILLVWYLILS